MKKSSGAALLSALVFPGLGHLFLKQYPRAFILLIASLGALTILIRTAYQRALTIVDAIARGDIPLDAVAIAGAAAGSPGTGGDLVETAAVIVLAMCWLIGIVDSYRIGALRESETRKGE